MGAVVSLVHRVMKAGVLIGAEGAKESPGHRQFAGHEQHCHAADRAEDNPRQVHIVRGHGSDPVCNVGDSALSHVKGAAAYFISYIVGTFYMIVGIFIGCVPMHVANTFCAQ
jgi:hypothetical protein